MARNLLPRGTLKNITFEWSQNVGARSERSEIKLGVYTVLKPRPFGVEEMKIFNVKLIKKFVFCC